MRYTTKLGLVLVFGALFAGLAMGPIAAQAADTRPEFPAVAGGIARLNHNLDRIAGLLQELLGHRRIELLIRRIELEERRLAPLGAELRGARDAVRAQREEIERMKNISDSFGREIDEAVRAGADPLTVPQRAELERMREMIELEQLQLGAAERRVIELEDDLARGQDRVAILDERLHELLEERGD